METIWDWITIAIVAALVVLFLQRSVEEIPRDRLIDYLPPAVGCAGANYLGNNDMGAFAAIAIVAVLVYSYFVLKPGAK